MISPDNVLFIDIETVPEVATFAELSEAGKNAFARKFEKQVQNGYFTDLEDAYHQQVGLLAEFTRVVSICGIQTTFNPTAGGSRVIARKLRIGASHASYSDAMILAAFRDQLQAWGTTCVGGHNILLFDVPFLSRRYIINGIKIPPALETFGKKPWDVNMIDTAQIWKFTDMSYRVSLASACYCFGLPDPKATMDGLAVAKYYDEGRFEEIDDYCFSDAIASHNIYCKMFGEPIYTPV